MSSKNFWYVISPYLATLSYDQQMGVYAWGRCLVVACPPSRRQRPSNSVRPNVLEFSEINRLGFDLYQALNQGNSALIKGTHQVRGRTIAQQRIFFVEKSCHGVWSLYEDVEKGALIKSHSFSDVASYLREQFGISEPAAEVSLSRVKFPRYSSYDVLVSSLQRLATANL